MSAGPRETRRHETGPPEPRARPSGRRLALSSLAIGVVVAAIAALALRESIAVAWHVYRLESADRRTSERAAELLLVMPSVRVAPEIVRAAHRHGYLESLLPRLVEEYSGESLRAAFPDLLAVLEGDNPFEWMAVMAAFKKLGSSVSPAVPDLIRGFEYWKLSPDFSIHHDILEIFEKLGPAAKPAEDLLRRALSEHDLEVQRLARAVLAKLNEEEAWP